MPTIVPALEALAVPLDGLSSFPGNPRRGDVEAIARSLETFGQRKPIVVTADGTVVAGNHTLLAARSLGWDRIAVVRVDDDPATAKAYNLADNRTAELGGYDDEALAALMDELRTEDAELFAATGWADEDLDALLDQLKDAAVKSTPSVPLADRFGVPPFSVLDARAGYWQARKQAWLDLGIKSEEGRDARIYGSNSTGPVTRKIREMTGGFSIFDPVLVELACRWFAPAGGSVLDPFAGGSVRGIVSALTGHPYLGVDLRPEQVAANEAQWNEIAGRSPSAEPAPAWTVGDARQVVPALPADERYDLVLSCPPYFDAEVYSSDPADLSAMSWEDFLAAYREIVAAAVARLRDDRFAVFVVGDVRDKRGIHRGFPSETIAAFADAGAPLYNEAVLVTMIGTHGLQAATPFKVNRKLSRVHQNVLVFYKGDPRAIRDQLGEVETVEPDDGAGYAAEIDE